MMLKNIVIVIVCLLLGVVTISVVQNISHSMYPLPASLDQDDLAQMRAYVMTMPIGAYLMVIASHALGAFVAAFAATKIAQIYLVGQSALHKKLALLSGGLLIIGGALLFYILPHPNWVMLVDILVYIPMAYLGYLLGCNKKRVND